METLSVNQDDLSCSLVSRAFPAIFIAKQMVILVFSLLYAFVLQSLHAPHLIDRISYLNYVTNSETIFSYNLSSGWSNLLANEPLWLLINMGLGQWLSPESVVRVIVFISSFVFSYVLLKADYKNTVWLMVFLLFPQILKNFITHLRQGLAISVFFAGYFSRSRIRSWFLMGLSPFIHASFFFILPMLAISSVLKRLLLGLDIHMLFLIVFVLSVSLNLGVITQAVGARQGEQYDFRMAISSGLGFVFWIGILGLIMMQGQSFLKRHIITVWILLFYLISYFFIEVAARIFESGLPLVLLTCLALTGWRRMTFGGAALLYGGIQWSMRLSSPAPF